MSNDTPELVELTLAGVERVSALWDATGMVIDDAEQQIAVLIERNPGLVLGLEFDNALIACTFGINEGYRGWIMRLGVLPEYRRNGYATRLVRELEERFRKIPVAHTALTAYTDSQSAAAFWTQLGYGTTEFTFMRKRLGDS